MFTIHCHLPREGFAPSAMEVATRQTMLRERGLLVGQMSRSQQELTARKVNREALHDVQKFDCISRCEKFCRPVGLTSYSTELLERRSGGTIILGRTQHDESLVSEPP